jgi:ABC-type multidrug transport system fused ATPase/permease subunit
VIRNPPILIFDEATSALDSKARRWSKWPSTRARGRTVLAVTHRLASAPRADRIPVMHEGQLAEEGTHDDLPTRGRIYPQLWRRREGAATDRPQQHSS